MSLAEGIVRLSTPMLQTGALMLYMLNALIYRPDDRQYDARLLSSSAMHVGMNAVVEDDQRHAMTTSTEEADEAYMRGETTPLLAVRGVYFAASITFDNVLEVYRLANVRRTLPRAQLSKMYGQKEPILAVLFKSTVLRAARSGSGRRRKTGVYQLRKMVPVVEVRPDGFEEIFVEFGMSAAGVHLEPSAPLIDPDDRGEHAEPGGEEDLDVTINNIWKQFPYDVMAAIPKPNDGEPYCTLGQEELSQVSIETYRSPLLPFSRVQLEIWRDEHRTQKCWTKTQFDRFFPPKGWQTPASYSHFDKCLYFHEWLALTNRLTPGDCEVVRERLKKEFAKILWFPLTASDKMWTTRAKKKAIKLPGETPAPIIAVNTHSDRYSHIGDIQLSRNL